MFPTVLMGALLGFGAFFDHLARQDKVAQDYYAEAMCPRTDKNGLGQPSASCERLAQARVRP
ncbi:MAG TPA: hypothetical protein VK981_16185 [Ramlibacter sp.]|nr:hypothetical protein [Ramlibacter sp.]